MPQANGQERDPEEAQRAAVKGAIHREQIKRMGASKQDDRARLLEVTVDSELEPPNESLQNLRAKDFPLANYDELADTFELKGIQEILSLFDEVRHPHPESVLQGAVREWAFGERGENLSARDPQDLIVNESYLLGTYSRATRGEEGMQQEMSAKQTRESITVDDTSSSSGRLRSKIPGL